MSGEVSNNVNRVMSVTVAVDKRSRTVGGTKYIVSEDSEEEICVVRAKHVRVIDGVCNKCWCW